MRPAMLRATSGFVVLAVTGLLGAMPPVALSQEVYRVEIKFRGERVGTTKNVEVGLHRDKDGSLHRRIAGLEGNQFAVRPLQGHEAGLPLVQQTPPSKRLLVPAFLPGDSGTHVRVDPVVGFSEVFSLKILDPVVLSMRDDGLIEADREGVRAILHRGSVSDTKCFSELKATKNEKGEMVYDFKRHLEPTYNPDGSWSRVVGELTDCVVRLSGEEGEPYVTRQVQLEGKPATVFVKNP